MRVALFTVALGSLVSSLLAQHGASRLPAGSSKHETEIFEAYLPDVDVVLVKSRARQIVRDLDCEIEFTAEFASPGKEVAKPDSILLGFIISHSRASKYDPSTHLVLKVDGKQIEFSTTRLKVFVLKDSVIEMLFTPIPHDIFLTIANAKTVQVGLGAKKLKLAGSHLRVLREVANRAVPHSIPE